MTKLGKLRTDAVAYLSLLVGAGLSVAGNLADTYRTRGAATGMLDQALAAAWPVLVLLAVHMFVNPNWSQRIMFQVWRWVGVLAIGGMAMVVSWTHLHDLMASRGQLAIVAILGPLAIDGMAIMATGLILSTRGQVATGQAFGQAVANALDTVAPGQAFGQEGMDTGQQDADSGRQEWPEDMSSGQHQWAEDMSTATDVQWTPPNAGHHWPLAQRDPFSRGHNPTRPDGDLQAWTDGYEQAIAEAGAEEVERWLAEGAPEPTVPVIPGPEPRSKRARGAGIPRAARQEILDWNGSAKDLDHFIADRFGISTRTARRWRQAVLGQSSAIPAESEKEDSDGEEEVSDL